MNYIIHYLSKKYLLLPYILQVIEKFFQLVSNIIFVQRNEWLFFDFYSDFA